MVAIYQITDIVLQGRVRSLDFDPIYMLHVVDDMYDDLRWRVAVYDCLSLPGLDHYLDSLLDDCNRGKKLVASSEIFRLFSVIDQLIDGSITGFREENAVVRIGVIDADFGLVRTDDAAIIDAVFERYNNVTVRQEAGDIW